MSLSVAGLIVSLVLFLLGRLAGGGLLIGFFASLPFASTAFATLSSLGGSSPMIYTLFALAIFLTVAARQNLLSELGNVFATYKPAWIAVALSLYAMAGAYILPRLFAGETTAFIPIEGAVMEIPLGPASGNITQTAYFLLGVFLFLSLCILLMRADNIKAVTRGYFAFVIAHILLGWIDFGAKLSGMGDVLLPIRTASYALLTEAEQSGFWRIVGGCPEASTYSGLALSALAFSFTYWRETGSRLASLLTVLILILVLLSTSSTAYVGLAALVALALATMGMAAFKDRLKPADLIMVASGLAVVTIGLAVYLYDSSFFTPFINLINAMVFDKANTDSGQERAYWNMKSIQSFFDTYGLGVGLGSSRSSSWIFSTLSQLGVFGSALVGALVVYLLRGMGRIQPLPEDKPFFALCAAARACAVAYILAGSIAGGSADPGVLFFASLATVLACRHHVLARRSTMPRAAHRSLPALFAGRMT